ncbi:MAG: O-antigen ligase family protein [bacterium]
MKKRFEPKIAVDLPVVVDKWNNIGLYLLMFAAFAVILAYIRPDVPLLYNSIETPRRLLLLLSAGIGGAILLIMSLTRGTVGRLQSSLDKPLMIYAGSILLAGLLGENPHLSFLSQLWSGELAIPSFATGVLIFLCCRGMLRTDDSRTKLIIAIATAGAVCALIGLIDHFFTYRLFPLNSVFSSKRLSATLGNPMFTGTLMAMIIPLQLGLFITAVNHRMRLLSLTFFMLTVAALVFTEARAAWIGFALSLIIVAFNVVRADKKYLKSIVVLLSSLFAAAVLIIILYAPTRNRVISIFTVLNNKLDTFHKRELYMETALNVFQAYPIFGCGSGNLKVVFPQYRPSSTVVEMGIPVNRGYASALPHNFIIQSLAETGIVGTLAMLFFIFMLFKSIMQQKNPLLKIGLSGALAAYLISSLGSFDNGATRGIFWLICGIAASTDAIKISVSTLDTGKIQLLRLALIFTVAITVTVVFMQFAGAYYTQQGFKHGKVGELYDAKLAFERAKGLTPIGDATCDKDLMELSESIRDSEDTPEKQAKITEDVFFYGESALRINDREPLVLRKLADYYRQAAVGEMQNNDQGEAEIDIKRSLHLFENLVRFEPNSSQVRISYAAALTTSGDLLSAKKQVEAALLLDPDYDVANIRMARYLNAMVKNKIPGADLPTALKYFEKGIKLGYKLSASEQQEYDYCRANAGVKQSP